MRIFGYFFLVVFVVLAFVIGMGVGLPVARDLGECVETYNGELNPLVEKAEDEDWSLYRQCVEYWGVRSKVLRCYDTVERKSILPMGMVFGIAKVINPGVGEAVPEKIVEEHNDFCDEYPDTWLGE